MSVMELTVRLTNPKGPSLEGGGGGGGDALSAAGGGFCAVLGADDAAGLGFGFTTFGFGLEGWLISMLGSADVVVLAGGGAAGAILGLALSGGA